MEDHGVPHPEELNRPALRDGCIEYLDAFRLLSAVRIWGESGPQPIQITEMSSYLDELEVTSTDERLKYIRMLRKLDRHELGLIRAQLDKQRRTT